MSAFKYFVFFFFFWWIAFKYFYQTERSCKFGLVITSIGNFEVSLEYGGKAENQVDEQIERIHVRTR